MTSGGGGISLLISPLNISLSFSQFPCFSFQTYLRIFCGWMPEFEDKAIKLLRNQLPYYTNFNAFQR